MTWKLVDINEQMKVYELSRSRSFLDIGRTRFRYKNQNLYSKITQPFVTRYVLFLNMYWAAISGEHLQDQCSSGLAYLSVRLTR